MEWIVLVTTLLLSASIAGGTNAQSGPDIDGCASNPCDPNATCEFEDVPAPGTGYTCTCNTGYEGDGYTCIDIDGCASSPCNPNASCEDKPAPGTGHTCTCNAGYVGDGYACIEIPGCATDPCDPNATCEDILAPGAGYTCTCNAGYTGDGYTCIAACGNFTDCSSCSQESECGWCDNTLACLLGDEWGPNKTSCQSWFYYGCFSAGETTGCSDQIEVLDCDDTHCNEELSSYNADVCEHCRGVESCFQQNGDVLCPGWNEAVCPGGLPAHNESAPQKNVVQLRDNVKAIDPAVTTLYACPVSLEDDYGDSAALFIAPYPTSFQDSDVIVSGQAGGVMHIVESIAPVGAYAFVLGNVANIEDVVAYSSFKEEVDPVAMDDETTEEDIPDPVLLSDAINGDLPIKSSNVTVVNNDVPVYKCVGNAYISSSEDEWVSTFLVFKAADFNTLASDEGDILAGTESNGWLETVTGGNAGDQFSFVKTDLMRCGEELPDENSFAIPTKSEYNIPDLHCVGGDNSKGILVYENTTLKSLGFSSGDIIVGRESGPFLSKVMSWTQNGDFVFVEVSPVTSLQESEDVTNSSVSIRRRRTTFVKSETFSKKISATHTLTLGPAQVTFGASAGFKLGFRFILELGWNPFLKQVGASFFGSAELKVFASASISGSVARTWTKMLKEGTIKPFLIPIGPIALPTKLRYEIPAKLEVSASVKYEISFEASASASASMGISWSHGSGWKPQFKTDFETDLKKDTSATAEGRAKLTGTITPTLLLDVPALGSSIKKPKIGIFKRLFERFFGSSSSSKSVTALLTLSVGIPITGSICGEFCLNGLAPSLKLLAYKAGVEKITLGVEVGVGKFTKDFERSIKIPKATIEDEEIFNNCNQQRTTASPSPAGPCIIDLVFLLDGSSSIGPVIFQQMKQFISDVIGCLVMTNIRVSVIRFDKIPHVVIPLGGYTSTANLQHRIMTQVYYRGSVTRTGLALYFIANMVFHPSIHKAAVFVTDGMPSSDIRAKFLLPGGAKIARAAGIELFCVAAGRPGFINYRFLTFIAGNPSRVGHWRQNPCVFADMLWTEICG